MRSTTLFHVLEDKLKEAKEPLTCNDLIDDPDIKIFTTSVNRVSDYLGALWRRGDVERYPAPRTRDSAARWSYQWKRNKKDSQPAALPAPVSAPTSARDFHSRDGKVNVAIVEKGDGVEIQLPHFTVTIRSH